MLTAVACGEDLIGALPDDALRIVLSLLPSRDAVRTCVLAKRWRTLWKAVPALRIHDPDIYDHANDSGPSKFVDELLRLRDQTPLDVCDISSDCEDIDWPGKAFRRMKPWLRHAIRRQARVIRLCFPTRVTDMTLVSSHLKRIELCRMVFEGRAPDFSGCHVLEVFEMVDCDTFVDIILSQSLRHLKILGGGFDHDCRSRISAPNLIGLRLAHFFGLTPLLDSMPSLVSASVTLGEGCERECYCGNQTCEGCDGQADNNACSVILGRLSGVTNLELTLSDPAASIFRKNLKSCPMFSKLKTLLLSDWSVGDDFAGLVYFLQHSPILEMLTLDSMTLLDWSVLDSRTRERQDVNKTNESYNPEEQPLLSKHLKVVKIICARKEDAMVRRIIKILRTHGVSSEQINIQ